MRFKAAISCALLSTFASMPLAQAGVSVTFVNSYYYPDIQAKRDAILADLRKSLQELGAQYFTERESLRVEVLKFEPVGVLVAKGKPSPSQMDIQYTLRQDGRVVMSDRETLSDVAYVDKPIQVAAKGGEGGEKAKKPDELASMKAMLKDWFLERFSAYAVVPTK